YATTLKSYPSTIMTSADSSTIRIVNQPTPWLSIACETSLGDMIFVRRSEEKILGAPCVAWQRRSVACFRFVAKAQRQSVAPGGLARGRVHPRTGRVRRRRSAECSIRVPLPHGSADRLCRALEGGVPSRASCSSFSSASPAHPLVILHHW